MLKATILILLVLFPLVGLAGVGDPPTAPNMPLSDFRTDNSYATPISDLSDVSTTIERLVTWLIYIFWIVAVAFLFWAAFLYLTGGDDEEKIKEAKSRVRYAIIAAAVALLSTGIDYIVWNVLIGKTT